jgi:dTDP-4-dehydrorhamnose 3,5-epimerase-like enzyme
MSMPFSKTIERNIDNTSAGTYIDKILTKFQNLQVKKSESAKPKKACHHQISKPQRSLFLNIKGRVHQKFVSPERSTIKIWNVYGNVFGDKEQIFDQASIFYVMTNAPSSVSQ